jgi:hypothetical protein
VRTDPEHRRLAEYLSGALALGEEVLLSFPAAYVEGPSTRLQRGLTSVVTQTQQVNRDAVHFVLTAERLLLVPGPVLFLNNPYIPPVRLEEARSIPRNCLERVVVKERRGLLGYLFGARLTLWHNRAPEEFDLSGEHVETAKRLGRLLSGEEEVRDDTGRG